MKQEWKESTKNGSKRRRSWTSRLKGSVIRQGITLKLLLAVCVLGAGMLVSDGPPAAACSCDKPKEAKEELARSSAVFAGKVVKIEGDTVHFDVAMLWRGPEQRRISLTNETGNTCSYPFQEGEEYLVYALGSESKLEASVCSRTVPVEQASDEVQALGNPIYNPVGEEMSRTEQRDLSAWYIGLASVLFLLVGYLLFTTLKRKRS